MSHTQNWPYKPLAGNTPTSTSFVWPIFDILFMTFGIGLLGWHHARQVSHEPLPTIPECDPLTQFKATPSMKATGKYFWTVLALFLAQILLDATTARYQVEAQQVCGFALANYLPYSLTRTWHNDLAVLWVATAWLAAGLYIAPLISAQEPKFQRLGVNFPWACLLPIVVGSCAGQWLAVTDKMGQQCCFSLGHKGWKYTDIGRFWQLFLFFGLMLFCVRGIKPDAEWREGLLRSSFWQLNIGLAMMAALTRLPLGIRQLKAVLEHGYWFARSAEFMDWPLVHVMVWMRVPGNPLFAIGALLISVFVAVLWLAPKRRRAAFPQGKSQTGGA
jgi:nitric oxide reductase large subunit